MKTDEAVQTLAAMAQETRLDALRLLVRAGPDGLSAGEIARRLDVPPPTLSFHLRAMLHAGLVSSTRSGRSLVYSADFGTLRRVVAFLTEKCCAEAVPAPRRRAAGR